LKNFPINYYVVFTILSGLVSNAQRGDFFVNKSNDTVYVDKIKLKTNKIKIKTNGKNKNYTYNDIKSFYISKANEHYVKVEAPYNENVFDERDEIFIIRLTKKGKINFYKDNISTTFVNSSGLPMTCVYIPYYIGINGSKPELIEGIRNKKIEADAYDLLKLYLYGNEGILNKLEKLYSSKQKNMIESIIQLIDEYNNWVKTTK
jgi:hypothetical protein